MAPNPIGAAPLLAESAKFDKMFLAAIHDVMMPCVMLGPYAIVEAWDEVLSELSQRLRHGNRALDVVVDALAAGLLALPTVISANHLKYQVANSSPDFGLSSMIASSELPFCPPCVAGIPTTSIATFRNRSTSPSPPSR